MPGRHTAVVIHCSSFCFGAAPIWREAIWPLLKIISVGIDWMPYLAAVCGFSSTLSLTIFTLPLSVPAISSSAGAIMRQGPHHSAQKSTTTGSVAFSTSESKVASETLLTAMGNTSFLLNGGWEANLGTRSASVKAASRRRDGGKRGVEPRVGNLHEIRHISPHDRGANALARVEPRKHGAIKRKLCSVRFRYVGQAGWGGAIGFVVGNQDGVINHGEAINLAGHCEPAALEPANDGDLGAASRQEQCREAWIVQ